MIQWVHFMFCAFFYCGITDASTNFDLTFNVNENGEANQLIGSVYDVSFVAPFMVVSILHIDLLFNEQNGCFFTRIPLDREKIASYDVLIFASNVFKRIKIIVNDVNDEKPVFNKTVVYLKIPESIPVEATMGLTSILDLDTTQYGIQRIEIVSGNSEGKFEVEIKRTGAPEVHAYLKLKNSLDYEISTEYSLTIACFDGGTPPFSASLSVKVEVENVNDEFPRFDVSQYNARISENTLVGTEVMRVAATDRDIGDYGQIMYFLDPQSAFFHINGKSGSVILQKALNLKVNQVHSLVLWASDGLHNSSAAATISIISVNSVPPILNLLWLNLEAKAEISESTAVGAKLAKLTVLFEKAGEKNLSVVVIGGYSLVGVQRVGNDFSLVLLRSVLSSDGVKDFHDSRKYINFTLQAMVNGAPIEYSTLKVTLYIVEQNNNLPYFNKSSYTASINSYTPIDTEILQISAFDNDIGPNGQLSYKLLPSKNHFWFRINSDNGRLFTATSSLYCGLVTLLVEARDSGTPPRASNVSVHIMVRGPDTALPRFLSPYLRFNLTDGTRMGICFGQLIADDPDCGPMHRFDLLKSTRFLPISLNEISGELCVKETLNRKIHKARYQLQVAVEDTGVAGHVRHPSYSLVAVRLLNLATQSAPYFPQTRVDITLRRDVHIGTRIASAMATNKNVVFNNQLKYTSDKVSSSAAPYLMVEADTGDIIVFAELPVSREEIKLIVYASDVNSGITTTPFELVVYLNDLAVAAAATGGNGFAFENTLNKFVLLDGTATKSDVGQLRLIADSELNNVTFFGVLTSQVECSAAAAITISTSGMLRTTGVELVRAQCPFLLMQVRCVDGSKTGTLSRVAFAQVVVIIAHGNRGSPFFPLQQPIVDISEESLVGTLVFEAYAEDPDDDALCYTLMDDAGGRFTLNKDTGALYLAQLLDYEAVTFRSLTVLLGVSMWGKNGKNCGDILATQNLTVNVLDSNDNAPTCRSSALNMTLYDSAFVGQQIGQLLCSDIDDGSNGLLTYAMVLTDGNKRVDPPFGINSINGQLIVAQALKPGNFKLNVRVSDNGRPLSRQTFVLLYILVLNFNDRLPQFQYTNYTFIVNENLSPGFQVGLVRAVESDIGKNSLLKYSIKGDCASVLELESNSGIIRTTTSLNREKRASYSCQVVAQDYAQPFLQSEVPLRLLVRDVNDEAPRFTVNEPDYRVNAAAESYVGTSLFIVEALDADEGLNALVHYSLEPPISQLTINPLSGVIKTSESLRSAAGTILRTNVVARDVGGLSDRRELLVKVAKSEQQWRNASVVMNVIENATVGTIIGKISAPDPTVSVYFSVIHGWDSAVWVHMLTGEVTVADVLDRERQATYRLLVVVSEAATTGFGRPRMASVNLTVCLDDVNDEAPRFLDAAPLILHVKEEAPLGLLLHTFLSVDKDLGLCGFARYSLISDRGSEKLLSIDGRNGEVRVANRLDREVLGNEIDFLVLAEDMCSEPSQRLNSTLPVHLFLDDINDNAPVFSSGSHAWLSSTDRANITLYHAAANDLDSGQNGQVLFVLDKPSKIFAIDSNTGLLRLLVPAASLMVDSQFIDVKLIAKDGAGRSTSLLLQISVLQAANKLAPRFLQSLYTVTVSVEPIPWDLEQPLIVLSAMSAGVRISGKSAENFVFALPQSMYEDLFRLEPTSGRLFLTRYLPTDVSAPESYELTVAVKLSSSPSSKQKTQFMDTATVVINVQPINHYAPVFPVDLYTLTIPEGASYTDVLTVSARDLDRGPAGELTYTILTGNDDNRFILNPSTGVLSCSALNVLEKRNYSLEIEARDGGGRSAICLVRVNVADINNHAPVFLSTYYSALVAENAPAGTPVLKVQAFDDDLNENGEIFYSLESGFENFGVDCLSGQLTTARTLDREKMSELTATIRATDGSTTDPKSALVTVSVRLEDRNDNRPVWSSTPFRFEIAGPVSAGTHLLTLSATDRDSPSNANLSYSLRHASQLFYIEASTGRLLSKVSLEPSDIPHLLHLLVRDGGSRPHELSADGVAVIRILKPAAATGVGVVSSSVVDSPSSLRFAEPAIRVATIRETASIGFVIATIRVLQSPSDVTYSLVQGNEDDVWRLDAATGQITLNKAGILDYESQAWRMSTIMALRPNNDLAFVRINISVLNDDEFSPRFSASMYMAVVLEKSLRGSQVAQVVAIDEDRVDVSGGVKYEVIDGDNRGMFVLNSLTGILSVNQPPDFVASARYKLNLEATSIDNPLSTASALLLVRVLNDNNQRPYMQVPKTLYLNVSAVQPGDMILQLIATDSDTVPLLQYRLLNSSSLPFSIDLFSGGLRLTRKLSGSMDAEREAALLGSNFVLVASVTDQMHTAEAHINVRLVSNQRKLRFDRSLYFFSLSATAALPNVLVGTLSIVSGSDYVNDVIYDFPDAEARSLLLLGSRNGEIRLRNYITEEGTLLVAARVRLGVNTAYTTLKIVIEANRSSRLPQFFPSFERQFLISELSVPGSVIGYLKCVDSNGGDQVSLSLLDTTSFTGSAPLDIVRHTGELVLTRTVDHESQPNRWNVSVQCVESAVLSLNSAEKNQVKNDESGGRDGSAFSLITMVTEDANDNRPVWSGAPYTLIIVDEEKDLPWNLALRVAATDADSGLAGQLSYSLVSGNSAGWLSIDSKFGTFQLIRRFPAFKSYEFVVAVADCSTSDGKTPSNLGCVSFSTYTIINVLYRATDTKSIGLFFPATPLVFQVMESDFSDVVIDGRVLAIDSIFHSQVHYRILDGEAATFFAINSSTGILRTRSAINYETLAPTPELPFRVEAYNTRSGERVTASVLVLVTDRDEFAPEFVNTPSGVVITGLVEVGQVLLKLTAVDQDSGSAGRIGFYLVSGDPHFEVNESSGELYMASGFSKENAVSSINRVRRSVVQTPTQMAAVFNSSEFELNRTTRYHTFSFTIRASSGILFRDKDVSLQLRVPLNALVSVQENATNGLPGTLVVLIVMLIVLLLLGGMVAGIIVARIRWRRHQLDKKRSATHAPIYYDSVGCQPVALRGTPLPVSCFTSSSSNNGGVGGCGGYSSRVSAVTTSSGHGSAMDDEEIDMDEGLGFSLPLRKGMPDSGLHRSATGESDSLTDSFNSQPFRNLPSPRNHVEYLARLGIATTQLRPRETATSSSFSLCRRSPSTGGGAGGGGDLSSLESALCSSQAVCVSSAREPSALSCMLNPAEVQGTWADHLLNWTPAYQPLAHVFAEIARLKDDQQVVFLPPPPSQQQPLYNDGSTLSSVDSDQVHYHYQYQYDLDYSAPALPPRATQPATSLELGSRPLQPSLEPALNPLCYSASLLHSDTPFVPI